MKPTIIFISSLAATVALTLSSCGDDKSSAEESGGSETSSQEATKPYPLKVCVVSGEDLGSMGKPHVITHEGTEVRLCCKECIGDFKKDPDKYIAMLKAGKAGDVDHSKHN